MITLNTKADCCGCTACFSVCHHKAIKLLSDKEGFTYPQINQEKCTNCGLCETVCPIHHPIIEKRQEPIIYAAINKNQQEYQTSSSGGIFITIAKQILSEEGCICGAAYTPSFKVVHQIAYTLKECQAFQGSKYVQSDLTGIYQQIKDLLRTDKKVLFTGTPCQVQGLKLYLRKTYENLYTCDLICHGVPSPKIFNDYINFIKEKSEIQSLNMKSKIKSEKGTAIQFIFSNGTKIRRTLKTDIWNDLYFKHFIIRPSCHECPFTNFHRPGDISIGDYWGASKFYPNFHKDKMISLVLVNSKKGENIISKLQEKIDLLQISKEESIQPQLDHPTPASPLRDEFWKDYLNHNFKYIIKKYTRYTFLNRFKESIKTLLKS